MSTVRVSYFDSAAVRRAATDYARQLAERHPEIEEVIVFGSLVKGTAVPGSDVDLLVILSASNQVFHDRVVTFMPTRFPVGMDVFPYTRAEIERMKLDGNGLILGALRDGQTLLRR